MGKSFGNPELLPIVCGKEHGYMSAIGRGASANVNRHVKYRASGDANEFVLGTWRHLEVKAPQDSLAHRQRMVVLDEGNIDSNGLKFLATVGLGEKPRA